MLDVKQMLIFNTRPKNNFSNLFSWSLDLYLLYFKCSRVSAISDRKRKCSFIVVMQSASTLKEAVEHVQIIHLVVF